MLTSYVCILQGDLSKADYDNFLDSSRVTLSDSAPTDSGSTESLSSDSDSGGSKARKPSGPKAPKFTFKAPKKAKLEFNKRNSLMGGAKQATVLRALIKHYNNDHPEKKIKCRNGVYDYDTTKIVKSLVDTYNSNL